MAMVVATGSSSSTGSTSAGAWAGSFDPIILIAFERSSSSSLIAAASTEFITGRPTTDRDSSATGASSGSSTLKEYLKMKIGRI